MASCLMFTSSLLLVSNVLANDLQIETQISKPQEIESPEQIVNADVGKAFISYRIVPVIIPKPPPQLLVASFDTANVSLGNEIFPTRTVLIPCIEFQAKSKTLYTFLMLDIDAPSQATPVLRSYIIALYVNIPDTAVRKGFSVAPYIPPIPEPGSGPHRYLLLVYQQCAEIDVKDDEILKLGVFRWRFQVLEFIKKYSFTELIAGNFYISEVPKEYADFC